MKVSSWLIGLLFVMTANQTEAIPFPAALDGAKVKEERLDDIGLRAFPVGNGDLNGLLWDRNGMLCIRVTKNDLWDARIDTSEDPPLLKMDVRNRTWRGGIGKVPSWNNHPYPQPRCAAVVTIGESGSSNRVKSAQLDLRRAVAVANATEVRVLADRNVILIDSPMPVALEEVKAEQLPPATLGETNGVRWLHMVMPGDVDYPGMEYALAVASRGKRKAVALVTSFDVADSVLEAALRLAQQTLDENTIPRHEEMWKKFWSASGLALGDTFFQNAWYRNLYYMRCFCKSGTALPITLYAGLAEDKTGWHGAPTLNYNFQQVFWPMLACNHLDSMEPYVEFLKRFAPRGRWLAKETYGVEGLFLPLNIFGPEHLVSPDEAKSVNRRQICYVPWTYTLGCTGWGLQPLWQRYEYEPDRTYLESIYPLLRDGAEFYANIMDLCREGEIGPSYNPEHGPFGTFNNPVDLVYFRFLFTVAAEAAEILGRDSALADRWHALRARVPDYETTVLNGQPIIANWKGADANSVPLHNAAVPTVPIFPAEEITWFSSDAEKRVFERTLRWLKYRDDNAHIMINVARARFSMPEAYTRSREHFSKILSPNGFFSRWPGHGYYLSESWAFAGLTAELLMQSVGDIIRVFPAWPQDQDAAFSGLRAQGGFLVASEMKSGQVTRLEIESTVGGRLRVVSPWDGSILERDTKPGEIVDLAISNN